MNRLPKHPFNREPGFSPVPSSRNAPASPSPLGAGATFQSRMTDCPDCDRTTDIRCETCWSSGEAEALCCDCGEDRPLNSDGECEQCSDGRLLTTDQWNAKHLCGWAKAEWSVLR